MTQPRRGKDGKFTGSIGAGKTKVPTAAPGAGNRGWFTRWMDRVSGKERSRAMWDAAIEQDDAVEQAMADGDFGRARALMGLSPQPKPTASKDS